MGNRKPVVRKDWNSCLFRGDTSGRLIVREGENTFKPEDSTGIGTKDKQKLFRNNFKPKMNTAPSCGRVMF